MPLKLSLTKGERIVVNGAVIKNDGPDTSLVFENRALILRQKDIMTNENASTPARRVYLALQCAYMFPERQTEHLENFRTMLGDYFEAAPSSAQIVHAMGACTDQGDLYGALKECRKLIEHEMEILEHVQ
jgi:flagellar biosynthesis repressor protein FlbT